MSQKSRTVRPDIRLEEAIIGANPVLASLLFREESGFTQLRIVVRGPMDVMALAKRVTPAHGEQIAFGSGYDVAGALTGLAGAIQADRWREERPWEPPG